MLSEVIDPRVRQGIPWPVPAGPYRHQFALSPILLANEGGNCPGRDHLTRPGAAFFKKTQLFRPAQGEIDTDSVEVWSEGLVAACHGLSSGHRVGGRRGGGSVGVGWRPWMRACARPRRPWLLSCFVRGQKFNINNEAG